MVEVAWSVIKEKFLQNVEWRKKFIKGGDDPSFDVESIRKHAIFGMNFPVRLSISLC